jgi:diaminohydroxyphosphoribosylaminopyrimidine deaminase/5-amino-6-(5-phosphoribosylamino)uracil reductase
VGTARADDPALTVRAAAAPRVAPLRIVFDRRAELPLDTRLARTAREVPTVVVAATAEGEHARALRALGVDVLPAPTLGDGLRQLRARGVQSVLVEGGARLAGALITELLVDRLVIFHAPLLLGAGALAAFGAVAPAAAAEVGRLALLDVARHGDDVAITYAAR